jgi:hypothetical protein
LPPHVVGPFGLILHRIFIRAFAGRSPRLRSCSTTPYWGTAAIPPVITPSICCYIRSMSGCCSCWHHEDCRAFEALLGLLGKVGAHEIAAPLAIDIPALPGRTQPRIGQRFLETGVPSSPAGLAPALANRSAIYPSHRSLERYLTSSRMQEAEREAILAEARRAIRGRGANLNPRKCYHYRKPLGQGRSAQKPQGGDK